MIADAKALSFGLTAKYVGDSIQSLLVFKLDTLDWGAELRKGGLKTADELVAFLKVQNKGSYSPDDRFLGDTLDFDSRNSDDKYAPTFDALTKRVFDELVNNGTRLDNGWGGAHDVDSKIPELANAKILMAFKTPTVDAGSAGANMGYYQRWTQYYILEIDGKCEVMRVNVIGSTYMGEKDGEKNVLNNKVWLVTSVKRTEINAENAKLFEAQKAQIKVATDKSFGASEDASLELQRRFEAESSRQKAYEKRQEQLNTTNIITI